jgi:hypothetical protein
MNGRRAYHDRSNLLPLRGVEHGVGDLAGNVELKLLVRRVPMRTGGDLPYRTNDPL